MSERHRLNMTRRAALLALCCCAIAPTHAAESGTLTLVAAQDTPIFGGDGGVSGIDFATRSNGAGYSLFVGMNGSGSPRRSLLQFDFSALPARARVTEATLVLALDRVPNASNQLLSVHVLTRAWTTGSSNSDVAGTPGQGVPATPGDATWFYASWPGPTNPAGVRWTTPGGDFLPNAVASSGVGPLGPNLAPLNYRWSGAGLAASVNAWLASPQTNFGWLLKGNESLTQSVKRFISREAVDSSGAPMDAALRPHLILSYVVDEQPVGPGGPDDATPPVVETSRPAGPFGQLRRRAAMSRPAPCCQ